MEDELKKKKQFLITTKQQEALEFFQDDKTDEIMLCGGAGSAKSIIAQFFVLKYCLKYAGFRVALVRKDITLSITTVIKSLQEVMELQGIPESVMTFDRQTNTYTFENGSEIILINGTITPIDRGNQISRLGSLAVSLCVIDEGNQIEEEFYDVMNTRVRFVPPSMDKVKYIPKMVVITNPDVNSFLYTRFWKKYKDGTLPANNKVIHSTVEDNPFMPLSYKIKMRNYKEPQYSRLYLGEWVAQSDDVLIEQDKLDNLFKPLDPTQFKPNRLSCDPARFGQDSTIICLADELTITHIIKLNNKSTKEVADEIKKLMQKYDIQPNRVIIDADGLGSGVCDNIRGSIGIHNNAVAVNRENYYNIKTQMFYKFSELADKITIICSSDDETAIKKEFGAIDKIIKNDDKWKITSKSEIKNKIGKSPDYADALAYLMYFNLKNNSGEWHIF